VNEAARWFAVARCEEVIDLQVVQSQLLGQELVLWRDATGAVNAWENRCPHRGVRLSLGFNSGTELRCQYHGWRFAAGGGHCTHIPAHPTQKPAAAIRATVYGSAECAGFVWTALAPTSSAPALTGLPIRGTTLRSMYVEASVAAVRDALAGAYSSASSGASAVAPDDFTLQINPGTDARVTFLLQPMTAMQTLIHGIVHAEYPAAQRLALRHEHNARLVVLRDALQST